MIRKFDSLEWKEKKRECQNLKLLSLGSKTLCQGNSILKNPLVAKFLLWVAN